MTTHPINLRYIPAQRRVRCELTKAQCDLQEEPPNDLIERSLDRMQKALSNGEIAFFRVFDTRLHQVWKMMRSRNDPPTTKVALTLAAGAPHLEGLLMEPSDHPKRVGLLSLSSSPEVIADWSYHFVKLTVGQRLSEWNVTEVANPVEIHRALIKAACGEAIVRQPLHAIPKAPSVNADPYCLIRDTRQKYIAVAVYDVDRVLRHVGLSHIGKEVAEAARLLSAESEPMHVLFDHLVRTARSAQRGPERFGIDLPLLVLASLASGSAVPDAIQLTPTPKGTTVSTPSDDHGQGVSVAASKAAAALPRLGITTSPDKMSAVIKGFQTAWYNSHVIDLDWIHQERMRLGLKGILSEETAMTIEKAIHAKATLNGYEIARGTAPVQAESPFLEVLYSKAPHSDSADESLDLRELQPRKVVSKDQVIAEIRYQQPAAPGRNVFGDLLAPPPPNETLDIESGDGVEERDGRFYACWDGVPIFSENRIEMQRTYVHKGDVDLRSGHVHFDGPVVIEGSVESGALVEAGGDLVIHGSINGGSIRCKGNLIVTEGLHSGFGSSIVASGNIQAKFIENAVIRCQRDVIIDKAAIGSDIWAAGEIRAPKGEIRGGTLRCLGDLKVLNLGQSQGAPTQVEVGVDFPRQARIKSLESRRAALASTLKRSREELRGFRKKKSAQLTSAHQTKIKILESKEPRILALSAKIDQRLHMLTLNPVHEEDSKIVVYGQLADNVVLQVGGINCPVKAPLAEVMVTATRHRGSHFQPLEDEGARPTARAG